MKLILCSLFCLTCTLIACKQEMQKSLDGRSYQISVWAVNQPEKQDPDLLVFKNGMMDSESCHQYGFSAAPYQYKFSKGIYTFTSTVSSPKEGNMEFSGTVNENDVTGKMVWKKAGQDDIHYEFRGNLKSM